MLVSVICIGIIGGVGYLTTARQIETVNTVFFVKLVQDTRIEALQHRRFEKDFFLNIGKPEKQANYIEKFKNVADSLRAKLKQLDGLEDIQAAGEIKNQIATAARNYESYFNGFFAVVKTVQQDSAITPQQANKLMTPVKKSIYNFENSIQTIVEGSTALFNKAAADIKNTGERTENLLIILFIVGAVLTAVIGILIRRSIQTTITRITGRLADGSAEVGAASGQLASASQQVAEGTSEQAASIEESSSSLEEMASMTRQNADNARQADDLMNGANRVVSEANQSMHSLTESMEQISSASEETSKIIKTIDEIAFQTNLLALNAAVEAARAGEAGAGFAVVADEVRNLAMRAADAARDTAHMIEDTVGKVNEGTNLVAKTSEAFAVVVDNSTKVGELISEIAAASDEQAQGIDQLNTAVAEMDKVTQQNAANAQESASASETMNLQAKEMQRALSDLLALFSGEKKESAVSEPALKFPTAGDGASIGNIYSPRGRRIKPSSAAGGLNSMTKVAGANRHSPEFPSAVANPAANPSPSKNPQQIIPMDDDDFEDF